MLTLRFDVEPARITHPLLCFTALHGRGLQRFLCAAYSTFSFLRLLPSFFDPSQHAQEHAACTEQQPDEHRNDVPHGLTPRPKSPLVRREQNERNALPAM